MSKFIFQFTHFNFNCKKYLFCCKHLILGKVKHKSWNDVSNFKLNLDYQMKFSVHTLV